jgi:site-specific DNA-methyltransferase (adenine-specific)
VARKPCEDTCVDNVMKYGVGGINIDECRIPLEETYVYKETNRKPRENNVFTNETCGFDSTENHTAVANPNGRFPSNVILTYDDTDKEEVCGSMPYTENVTKSHLAKNSDNNVNFNASNIVNVIGYEDNGSAARYFYCAKASKRDRDEGLDAFETQHVAFSNQGKAELNRGNVDFSGNIDSPLNAFNKVQSAKNTHPTVKPTSLMGYLIRLVTPKGGTVLDPFNGSGSTGKACMYENVDRNAGYTYIGIELTSEYLLISKARIEYAATGIVSAYVPNKSTTTIKKPNSQINLFEL